MSRRNTMSRITVPAGTAAGGLLATAFLPVAVALADSDTARIGEAGAVPISNATSTSLLGDAGSFSPWENAAGTVSTGPAPAVTPPGNAGATTPTGETPGATPTGESPGATPTGEAPGTTPTGEAPGSSDALTIGNDTFTPIQADGTEGFSPVSPLFSAPPFFEVGEGNQTFELTSGTGSSATDLGSIGTSEDVSDLFGVHSTEFTVNSVDPAGGETAADLPAVGSVYDVTNFGQGFENVYSDIPGSDGSGNTITDTLVTPSGDFNIPTDFDAIAALDPGNTLSGVDVSSLGASAAGGATSAAGNAADAAGNAAGNAADAAGGAVDATGAATDAAGGGAADTLDPLSFLGF